MLALLASLFVHLENQRKAVVAKPLSCRRWPIIEYMAVMAAADRAVIFNPGPDRFVILFRFEGFGKRIKETRPTGAAIEFHL